MGSSDNIIVTSLGIINSIRGLFKHLMVSRSVSDVEKIIKRQDISWHDQSSCDLKIILSAVFSKFEERTLSEAEAHSNYIDTSKACAMTLSNFKDQIAQASEPDYDIKMKKDLVNRIWEHYGLILQDILNNSQNDLMAVKSYDGISEDLVSQLEIHSKYVQIANSYSIDGTDSEEVCPRCSHHENVCRARGCRKRTWLDQEVDVVELGYTKQRVIDSEFAKQVILSNPPRMFSIFGIKERFLNLYRGMTKDKKLLKKLNRLQSDTIYQKDMYQQLSKQISKVYKDKSSLFLNPSYANENVAKLSNNKAFLKELKTNVLLQKSGRNDFAHMPLNTVHLLTEAAFRELNPKTRTSFFKKYLNPKMLFYLVNTTLDKFGKIYTKVSDFMDRRKVFYKIAEANIQFNVTGYDFDREIPLTRAEKVLVTIKKHHTALNLLSETHGFDKLRITGDTFETKDAIEINNMFGPNFLRFIYAEHRNHAWISANPQIVKSEHENLYHFWYFKDNLLKKKYVPGVGIVAIGIPLWLIYGALLNYSLREKIMHLADVLLIQKDIQITQFSWGDRLTMEQDMRLDKTGPVPYLWLPPHHFFSGSALQKLVSKSEVNNKLSAIRKNEDRYYMAVPSYIVVSALLNPSTKGTDEDERFLSLVRVFHHFGTGLARQPELYQVLKSPAYASIIKDQEREAAARLEELAEIADAEGREKIAEMLEDAIELAGKLRQMDEFKNLSFDTLLQLVQATHALEDASMAKEGNVVSELMMNPEMLGDGK